MWMVGTFVYALAAAGDYAAGNEAAAPQTAANRGIELTFHSSLDLENPWGEMELDAIVVDPHGRQRRVPAFWAGGRTWRIRYSSPLVGEHRYKTECTRRDDDGLHRQTGVFNVVPYEGDHPLYRHGPIRVAADRRHFEHADGTPFLWLADTWWMGLCKRLHWPAEFEQLTEDRRRKGFNVVQIVAGLYPDMAAFDPLGDNEAGQPWETGYAKIRPEYFDAADQRLAHLVESGMTPAIVGAWGFHLNWLGVDKMQKHWRYLVARYGAWPVVWVAAGEGTLPYYLSETKARDEQQQRDQWTEMVRYIGQIDPFDRPLTIHPKQSSRQTIDDPHLLSFDMLQTGHGGRHSIRSTLHGVRASLAAWPLMPCVNGEVCYEGILGTCHDDLQRFMAWSCLLSGAAGHTYGANGIWQVNREEKPFGRSPHGLNWGNTPWNEARQLPGSRHVGLAAELLRRYPFEQFEPHPEWAAYRSEASPSFRWQDWIWHAEGDPANDAPTGKRYFRKTFHLPEEAQVVVGRLRLAPDEDAVTWLNGRRIGRQHGISNVIPMTIQPAWLRPGKNVLAVEVDNQPSKQETNPAGLLATLSLELADGQSLTVVSDESWRSAEAPGENWTQAELDDADWQSVRRLGPHGSEPWGFVSPRGRLATPKSAGIPGRLRITYLPTAEPAEATELPAGVVYQASYVDPKTGETSDAGVATGDDDGRWPIPAPPRKGQDWVLVLERSSAPAQPLAIHPENPKYFLFRGKPLTLITATEHYGSIVNRAFDFEAYLRDMADKKQTVTRTFLLFREQQTDRNPHSPIKPESPEYLTPYPRTGSGEAHDGEPRYDLDQWNPEFFDRLDRFMSLASESGVVVELTLFGNVYTENVWQLNPLHADNNIQELKEIDWRDFITLRHPQLVRRQKAYIAKIVEETCQYDNLYYEICNEPGGDRDDGPDRAEVNRWQAEMARTVRSELKRRGRNHLIAGSEAFSYSRGYRQGLDHALAADWVQVMNFHSYPKIDVDGETWKMGGFMTKDLLLEEIAGLCRALQKHPKPCSFDEDNVVNLYETIPGWTVQRKRAWATVMGQAHYDFIDFSVTVGHETGTEESSRHIRTWMKHLSEFFHSFDFVHAEPIADWLVKKPPHTFASVLAVAGNDYVAYLADRRELGDVGAGEPIEGTVAFSLPEGRYRACLYSPTTGAYSPAVRVAGGGELIEFDLASFRDDVVLRVTRDR